jgi:hypothetical protein
MVRPAGREITTYGPDDIGAPLPPVSFLIDGLRIGRGAPLLLAGPSFIGKTVIAQSLMLAIASGTPVWGVYSCRPASVLHIDLEQGKDLTFRRYQRLAKAAGIDVRSLEDRIRVAVKPAVRLDAADAEDVYARAFEGRAFVLIDCLRAAAPTADENASDVRQYIDLVDRVAEKTGTVPAFIHHMKKPSGDGADNPRHAIRGSSAIFDACGAVFAFSGEKGKPARVHHEKERQRGVLLEDFGLAIEDVEVDGVHDAGLRVRHLEPEELAQQEMHDPKLSRNVERLRAHFAAHQIHHGNRAALREVVRMKGEAFSAAFSVLLARGEVVEEPGPTFRWTGASR